MLSTTSPIVIEKDGETQTVAIRRAYTKDDGTIVVEAPTANERNTDLTALLFQTVKLCSKDQISRLEDKFELYEKKDKRMRRGARPKPKTKPTSAQELNI